MKLTKSINRKKDMPFTSKWIDKLKLSSAKNEKSVYLVVPEKAKKV